VNPQPGANASPIYGKAGAVAPVAVAVFDVDRPADLDLGTTADGNNYKSALIVLRRAGAPVGAMVIPVEGEHLGAFDIAATADIALEHVTAQPEPLPNDGALATIVVTTCNQPASLIRCLDALLSSNYKSFEIIVVENRPGPQSRTRDALRGYDTRVRYVEEPVPGLSRARNAGLVEARGEVVAFTDDDVVVDPDWLPALVAAFDAAPDVDAVTGLILPLTLDSEAQLLLEQFAAFGKGFAPITHRLAEGRAENPLFPYTAGELGSGANTAVRTGVLRAMGGFDVALGAGTPAMGGEDLDLLIRLVLDGHAVRYEPRALLWHDHPATMERLTTQVRSYGIGLAAMAAKHLMLGDERAYLLRQAPTVFRYLLSPGSRKNEQKGPEFPRDLVVRERLGMVEGPLALARSRRETRRANLAAESFRPTWITDIDLAHGVRDLAAPPRRNEPYRVARVLVRLRREPLGFVEVDLDDEGHVAGGVIEDAVRVELKDVVADPPATGEGPHHLGTPPVTVVVSTRDREDSLRTALKSLLAVDYPDFDVVVVDNAAKTDDTANVVIGLADPRVRMIKEPIPGLSRARNTGVAHAMGEIVAFTDDDVVVDPGWLRALVRGFTRDPNVACVTGMVPSAELETPAQAYFDVKVGWADSSCPRLFDLDANRIDQPLYPYLAGTFGAGANFAATRAALDAIGPFDEALGAGSPAKGGEDIDYFLRTILAGKAIAYEPAAIVWHVHRRELAALRGQMDGYGSGLSAFAFKHLMAPQTAVAVARRVPAGVLRMRQLRDRGASEGDPLGLWAPELKGFSRGPVRYLRGRRGLEERPS
jgi:GT2 family glycosyltransferase